MITPIMHLLNQHPFQPFRKGVALQLKSALPIKFLLTVLLWSIAFIATGCIASPTQATIPQPTAGTSTPDSFNGAVADIADYALPTPVPTAEVKPSVVVNTEGSRANIRSGPGTNAPIIGKGNPGDAFEVVGRSEDGAWWQICCVPGTGANSQITNTAWIAALVVRIGGAGDVANVNVNDRRVLPNNFSAQWQVDWTCGSDRCQVQECTAVVDAKVGTGATQPFLTVENQVTWSDTCFATDSWVFEVDQFTGKERTGEYTDNFLYSYWRGQQPGAANGVYTLDDGKAVAVFCSGPHTVELEEGDGWTTVYEGNTCHDTRSGLLVLLSYNKRWLFTGEFEGETYDHAYFGDSESLEQRLANTNIELFEVQKK